ncbi:hypothetical protein [Achromobacter sp. ESBL13]|uniref:hypothetical protein n=1 Tax=Achromobacter sp. ESBL13 TaxID=3077328 RepID=UPI002FCC30A8
MNTTPINAVDCSPVLMVGWRAKIGNRGLSAGRALFQMGLSFGVAARRVLQAGAVKAASVKAASVKAASVKAASVKAASAQAGFRHIHEAQMKKARRIRQAFIKFGCGGRI